jgi:hypothetical protein
VVKIAQTPASGWNSLRGLDIRDRLPSTTKAKETDDPLRQTLNLASNNHQREAPCI